MTARTISLLAATLLSSTAALAATETRELSGFSSIVVADDVDVRLVMGEKHSVVVSSRRGNPRSVLTTLQGRELLIERRARNWLWGWWNQNDYQVTVTLPAVDSVSASGGADVRGDGVLKGTQLRLSASGASDVRLDVSVHELHLRASGGADIKVSGQAQRLHARASGGAEIDSYGVVAADVEARASGGADLGLHATGTLSAVASGGSDIRYRGNPSLRENRASGGAEIARR